MSPRTLMFPPLLGALLLSAACGAPPEALPTGPPLPRFSSSLPAGGLVPSAAPATMVPAPTYTQPTYVTPPLRPTLTVTTTVPTTSPPTTSPSPTPSQAAQCTREPTGAQIVTLVKENPAVPGGKLSVSDGPYCSGVWAFTTIGKAGAEPLSVVTTGKGTTLALVTLGTDVCNPRVKAEAPAGIRVLACGF